MVDGFVLISRWELGGCEVSNKACASELEQFGDTRSMIVKTILEKFWPRTATGH